MKTIDKVFEWAEKQKKEIFENRTEKEFNEERAEAFEDVFILDRDEYLKHDIISREESGSLEILRDLIQYLKKIGKIRKIKTKRKTKKEKQKEKQKEVIQEYKLMCEESKEIQELKKLKANKGGTFYDWQDGDRYFWNVFNKEGNKEGDEIHISDGENDAGVEPDFLNPHWLPRLKQLQEMVRGKFKSLSSMLSSFNEFDQRTLKVHRTLTKEQLWLAFVMKEKYNKIWNGEQWI